VEERVEWNKIRKRKKKHTKRKRELRMLSITPDIRR